MTLPQIAHPDVPARAPEPSAADPVPWTRAGAPDAAYSDADRERNVWLLTDPDLATGFRYAHRRLGPTDYEAMIRILDLVWECPQDGHVNVTGFRCAGCSVSRARLTLGRG
jgi:hypothetical protein